MLIRSSIALLLATSISGCGIRTPSLQEPWEDRDIGENLGLSIRKKIFCELIDSIRYVNGRFTVLGRAKFIPDHYGVQIQTTLSVDEESKLNPGATYTRTLRDGIVYDNPVSRFFSLSLGGTLSSKATRSQTSYNYYNVGKITAPGANAFCHTEIGTRRVGTSLLHQQDLGISTFLVDMGKDSNHFPSSAAPKSKASIERGIYSYQVKFVVTTSGSVTPGWKLVAISSDNNGPLFSADRTRTHDLTLTFSPEKDPSDVSPSNAALQTHFNSQLIQSLDRLRSGGR